MANGEGERVFLDTNILVYANIAEAPFHHAALKAIETHEQAGASLWALRLSRMTVSPGRNVGTNTCST